MEINFLYEKDSILPAPSEETLKSFEDYWKVLLPKDYLYFINEYNGIILEEDSFFILNNKKVAINEFCSILDRKYLNDPSLGFLPEHDINVIDSGKFMFFTDKKNEDELGGDVIPIAIVYHTCYVCFDCRKDKNNPTICFYDIDLVEDENNIELDKLLTPITEKFSDFLNMIKSK